MSKTPVTQYLFSSLSHMSAFILILSMTDKSHSLVGRLVNRGYATVAGDSAITAEVHSEYRRYRVTERGCELLQ